MANNFDASPPARVAWIETHGLFARRARVCESPPARVAWIETLTRSRPQRCSSSVATREGGVDRNAIPFRRQMSVHSRHPRGWRG